MALDLQNLKNKITSAKDMFANALFGTPAQTEGVTPNVSYGEKVDEYLNGLGSQPYMQGLLNQPKETGLTLDQYKQGVANGLNYGVPEIAQAQKELGINIPKTGEEIDLANAGQFNQPTGLSVGTATTPRQGGFFNDLAKGYEENLTQKFDFQNLAPDKNKSFATRLGEGAGSLVSFYNKPIARGLLGAAAALALGGGAGGALAMGLGTTVARQRNMTKDSAYRQNLQQMGYTPEEIDSIPGIVSDDIYSNLIRAKQLQDNAEYRNMLLENQQANTAAQLEFQRMKDVYDRAQKEREFNYRASQDAFDNYIASENLKAKQQEGVANAADKGDTTFQQLQLLEDAFKNMPQAKAGYGKKAKAVLTGATNLIGLRNDDVTAYEAIRNPLVTTLARSIAGEKGVLTDKDFARAEKMVPTAFDSPEQAQAKFEQIKKLVGVQYGTTPSQATTQNANIPNVDLNAVEAELRKRGVR
jgi:hypothetical protein